MAFLASSVLPSNMNIKLSVRFHVFYIQKPRIDDTLWSNFLNETYPGIVLKLQGEGLGSEMANLGNEWLLCCFQKKFCTFGNTNKGVSFACRELWVDASFAAMEMF
ncbi:hypothetical protein V6N13_129799 [Hibiscus sabdariffa]